MNELFSPLRSLGRIELSAEPPFRLGALTVRPAALEIEGRGGTEALEPRVMQVLVALFMAGGEPVTREELSLLCWEGRIVGDDALVRCVGRLRKVLRAEPAASIDTIPKVGYRLKVKPAASDEPEVARSEPVGSSAKRPQASARLVAACLAVLIGAGAAVLAWSRAPASWSVQAVSPLTSEPGVETHPALSPDGRFLLYGAAAGFLEPRDLYMRAVGEGAPLQLTSGSADDFSPVWSPDGRRMAFVRQSGTDPCTIVLTPIPRGAERVVARCRLDPDTRLGWTGDGELIFSDRLIPGEARRLRAVNVESGAVRNLTRPAAETLGDFDPAVSPDGRLVAFRRSISAGVDDLYWVDPRTGQERRITRDGWKSHGFAFGADGRTLFFASNRGGDFGLWSVDIRRAVEPRRVSLGLLSFGRMSADRQGRLAVETSGLRQNLFVLTQGSAAPTLLTASSARDWDAEVGPRGLVIFGSDRSGAPELWIRRPGAEPSRMTSLGGSYVGAPRWSPDGAQAVFLAARGRETDLYAIRADGAGLRRLTRGGGAKADPVWTPSGVLYAARGPRGWGLARVRSDGSSEPLAGGEGFTAVRTARGALYGLRAGDSRLWTLPAGGGVAQPAIKGLVMEKDPVWSVTDRGLYQVRDRGSDKAALWLTGWDGGERRIAALPPLPFKPTISVDPMTEAVVFTKVVQDEINIALLQLKS